MRRRARCHTGITWSERAVLALFPAMLVVACEAEPARVEPTPVRPELPADDRPPTNDPMNDPMSEPMNESTRVIEPSADASGASDPAPGFVDLAGIDGVQLDVRYARADNFTGAPLPGYERPGAWLRAPAAAAFERAVAGLAADGFGVVVYDAYRPRRASVAMARWARGNGREAWLDGWISERSQHNRGTAIDLGLIDLDSGAPVAMGSEFDTFTAASHHAAKHEPAIVRNRARLRDAMVAEGFEPYWREWWHYGHPSGGAAIDVGY